MIILRRVTGYSMSPGIMPGDVVIGWNTPIKRESVVVAKQNGREVIKRVFAVSPEGYDLRGDNLRASTDSRTYGLVKKQDILATVMIALPALTTAPKAKNPWSRWLGLGLAVVMTVFALIHLFRIDTFLPLLGEALGFGIVASYIFTVGIVVMEVFAVPMLLRMRLSPLVRFMSGMFAMLAPLFWLSLSILNIGTELPLAQLGEFVDIRSGILPIIINAMWLGLSVYTLYLFNFNWPERLSKKL